MTKVIYQLSIEPSLIEEVRTEVKGNYSKQPNLETNSQIISFAIKKFVDYEVDVKLYLEMLKQSFEKLKIENTNLIETEKALRSEISKINNYRNQLEVEVNQLKKKQEELINELCSKNLPKPRSKKRL